MSEINFDGIEEEEYALRQLHYWLRYESLSVLGGGAAFWIPYGLIVAILGILAALFAPYMLWRLWTARWYKSIVVFVVLVVFPFVAFRFIPIEDTLAKYLVMSVPLVNFYIYTWVLRLVLGEHLEQARLLRQVQRGHRPDPLPWT